MTRAARPHAVVVNDEKQYSVWPVGAALPVGWHVDDVDDVDDVDGFTGTEEECLAYIEQVWTDMRPASLRRWMADRDQAGAAGAPVRID